MKKLTNGFVILILGIDAIMTTEEILNSIGISQRSVSVYIDKLKGTNLIDRVDLRKKGSYKSLTKHYNFTKAELSLLKLKIGNYQILCYALGKTRFVVPHKKIP